MSRKLQKVVVVMMISILSLNLLPTSIVFANENEKDAHSSLINSSVLDSQNLEESASNIHSETIDEKITEEESLESLSEEEIPEESSTIVEDNIPNQEDSGKEIVEKDVYYNVQVINKDYYIYPESNMMDEVNKKEVSEKLLYQSLTVLKEREVGATTWLLISIDKDVLGWIEQSGVELMSNESEAPSTFSMKKANTMPILTYSSHIQDKGWITEVKAGEMSGTTGLNKQMEALKINLTGMENLNIEYSSHVQDIGWMDWINNNEISGTVGQSKQMEALKIRLTGAEAEKYDIFYRVHTEDYGWLHWTKNGENAGTVGLLKHIEAVEIVLQEKGLEAPGPTEKPYIEGQPKPANNPSVRYDAHVQDYGWNSTVKDGGTAGTTGKRKNLEALKIRVDKVPELGVKYSTHVEDYGWMNWVSNGQLSGTTGKSKKIEAIKIQLTGNNAKYYDIYYRIHSAEFGWLGWAKNGAPAGLEGYNLPAEAIEIKIVAKGTQVGDSKEASFVKFTTPSVKYVSHVEDKGWLVDVKNGAVSGTIGEEKQMEALKISLENAPYAGNISYQTHVEDKGWQKSVSNGSLAGTVGKQKQIEAINIKLSGALSRFYDIYYRTHIEDYGWLGWAKNGMNSGSQGMSKRIEAIQIKLVKKNTGVSVDEDAAFKEKKVIYLDAGHGGSESGASYYGAQEKNLNLSVAKKVQSRLEKLGHKVIMSRKTDKRITLIDRAKEANKSGADIFVSVHHNAMPRNSSVKGIETYYYEYNSKYQPQINKDLHNDPRRLKESAELASEIHKALINNTGATNRGIKRNTFAVLRETKMPAVLLELGYMSSPVEIAKLKTNSYQNKLADAVANGVHRYFRN